MSMSIFAARMTRCWVVVIGHMYVTRHVIALPLFLLLLYYLFRVIQLSFCDVLSEKSETAQ